MEDLDLEGRLAPTTRELYEWNMRHLVLPTFEHLTLREITVTRVDRFLKTQAKASYSRAKHSKVALSSALGLAVCYEAIPRNPGRSDRPAAQAGPHHARAERGTGAGDPCRRAPVAAATA